MRKNLNNPDQLKKEKQDYEEYVEKRITDLIYVISNIALGDFTVRAKRGRADIIGALADGINMMLEEIKERERELEERTEELEKVRSNLEIKVNELSKMRAILYSLAEDIQQEREKVEEKVRERTKELSAEHGRLLSLVESIKLGVVMVDLNLNIILANSAAKAIFGKSPAESLEFKDLEEKLKGLEISQALSYYVQTGKVLPFREARIGDRYFHIFLSPVRDVTEKIFIGAVMVIEDITEEKRLAKMRTEIISVTSHQLRTPLSVIKGNLEMILGGEYGKITKEQREILEEAFLGNERMIKLVNDLMDVSKIEEGRLEFKLKPTKLEDLVAETVKQILPITQKDRVALSYIPPVAPLPKVNIDSRRIKQVLQNLIDNAIKYSRADTRGRVTVKIEKSGDFLKTIVKDNGVGIPKDEQEKIFERFYRASNVSKMDPGGGTGLGLYVCKAIVEQHGGKIWFVSEGEGKGTTFYFTLPIMQK